MSWLGMITFRPHVTAGCLLLSLAWGLDSAGAQTAGQLQNRRDAEGLRREIDGLRQSAPPGAGPSAPAQPSPPASAPQPWAGRVIEEFLIEGADQHATALLQLLRQTCQGQPATAELLATVRERVVAFFAARGLIAIVRIDDPDATGRLGVGLTLSSLGRVIVDVNQAPIASAWAVRTVEASVAPGSLLRLDKLESALLKLNDLAGVSAEARLSPGERQGQTDVVLALSRTSPFQAVVDLNNQTLPYMGPYQAEAYAVFESPLGRGDYLTLDAGYSGNVNWYGSRSAGLDVAVPLTPDGLRVIGSYGWSDYRLLEQYTASDSVGSSSVVSLGLAQPLWRRPRTNLEWSVSGGYGAFHQSELGVPAVEVQVPVGRMSLRADHQDDLFGGVGLNASLLAVSAGGTQSPQASVQNLTPYAAAASFNKGLWGKLYVLYDRYQSFKDSRLSLELFAQGQLASGSLYSSEQFSLGWPNAVRAYPPGEATGDVGLSFQFTSRYQLFSQLTLKAFVDAGWIWPPSETALGAAVDGPLGLWGPGVGLEFGPRGNYLLSVDVAFPLGRNAYNQSGLDADGTDPDVRVWLSLKKWL